MDSIDGITVQDKVFEEYMDALDTQIMTEGMKCELYIPSVFDLANAFPGASWDEAKPILEKEIKRMSLFIRYKESYMYKPIVEVW